MACGLLRFGMKQNNHFLLQEIILELNHCSIYLMPVTFLHSRQRPMHLNFSTGLKDNSIKKNLRIILLIAFVSKLTGIQFSKISFRCCLVTTWKYKRIRLRSNKKDGGIPWRQSYKLNQIIRSRYPVSGNYFLTV